MWYHAIINPNYVAKEFYHWFGTHRLETFLTRLIHKPSALNPLARYFGRLAHLDCEKLQGCSRVIISVSYHAAEALHFYGKREMAVPLTARIGSSKY